MLRSPHAMVMAARGAPVGWAPTLAPALASSSRLTHRPLLDPFMLLHVAVSARPMSRNIWDPGAQFAYSKDGAYSRYPYAYGAVCCFASCFTGSLPPVAHCGRSTASCPFALSAHCKSAAPMALQVRPGAWHGLCRITFWNPFPGFVVSPQFSHGVQYLAFAGSGRSPKASQCSFW